MRREIAIISTDQATTAAAAAPSRHGRFLQKSPLRRPHHLSIGVAQRSTAQHSTAQHRAFRALFCPSHASIKRKTPRPGSVPVPVSVPVASAAASLSYTYIAWTNIVKVSSGQSIAYLRESRRDARELLLSTWDGDMPSPAIHNRITYRNNDISSYLPRCGAITSSCHARHGRFAPLCPVSAS
jgi:hypothetical protein